MAVAAGHELIHYKEPIHKFVGSFIFIITFQSHFWDEHVKGHHKNVGTLEDPVFPPVGRNIYYAVIYA
jgi:alkane 1-monooxygenase